MVNPKASIQNNLTRWRKQCLECDYVSYAGFKISNTSCCNVDTNIGGLCLSNSKLCSNRSEYVFWDAFHPSDAANAVLADKLFSSLFSAATSPAPAPSL